jgi:hypothetical protein
MGDWVSSGGSQGAVGDWELVHYTAEGLRPSSTAAVLAAAVLLGSLCSWWIQCSMHASKLGTILLP